MLINEQFDFEIKLRKQIEKIENMLINKNKQYGNSALDPIRVFSKSEIIEQINVRLDDKLSRIKRGIGENEDPELDIIGYLILKRIYKSNES